MAETLLTLEQVAEYHNVWATATLRRRPGLMPMVAWTSLKWVSL